MFAKHTKSAAFAGFLTLLLAGCGTEEEGGTGGTSGSLRSNGEFSVQAEMKVLEIVPEADGEPGTIETRSYDEYCDGDELIKDSTDELQSYVVDGGKLYMWDETDETCEALKLSGSSSTIIGKWSTTDFMSSTRIPAPYRPEECDDLSDDEEDDYEDIYDSVFQDFRVSYDVSATRVKTSVSGKLCMGPLLGASFAGGGFGAFEVISSDCGSATIENTYNDRRLKISTRFTDGNLKVTFSSSGKSCSYSEPALFSATPVCPEPDYSEEQEAFDACIEDLAFFQDMEGDMAKRGSASSRLDDAVKQVRRAARGL